MGLVAFGCADIASWCASAEWPGTVQAPVVVSHSIGFNFFSTVVTGCAHAKSQEQSARVAAIGVRGMRG